MRVIRLFPAFVLGLTALLALAPRAARAQEDDNPPGQPGWAKDFEQGTAKLNEKKYDEAIALYEKVIAADADNEGAHYNIACAYALQGKKAEAIEWFEKAVGCGYDDLDHLKDDTDLDSIRDDPKFLAIVESIRQRDKEKGAGAIVFRAPEGLDASKPAPLIVALHGQRNTAEEFAKIWEGPALAAGCVLACPQGSQKTGAKFSWVEKRVEEQVLLTVEQAKAKYAIDPNHILLAGYSQAGQYTYVLGLRHPEIFSAVAPLTAFYDPLKIEGPLIKAEGMGAYILIGKKDGKSVLEDAQQARDDLQSAGLQVVYEEYDGKHRWPENREEYVKKIIAWFVGLERHPAPAPDKPPGPGPEPPPIPEHGPPPSPEHGPPSK